MFQPEKRYDNTLNRLTFALHVKTFSVITGGGCNDYK